MAVKTLTRFRLSTMLQTVVIAVGLGWAIDHGGQHSNLAEVAGLLRREQPWIDVEEDAHPDWRTSTLASDEFRLSVRRLVDESDQPIVMLTIETHQPQWHSIWSHGTTWVGPSSGRTAFGTIDQRRKPSGYFTGKDTLTATHISDHAKQFARMNVGGGSTTREVPLKTPLNRVLEITAKDGVDPLHEPIVIGNAFDVDVKLAVGDRAKVDAMS